MGLEILEIRMWAEERFSLKISNKEAREISTVGEFAQYISANSKPAFHPHSDYEAVYDMLVDLLVSKYNIPRESIVETSLLYADLGLG
ncbi:hypothetical protein [Pseudoalteromonas umbrosa]|uniref:hypothetical protein n=1 Tax=Pseudoalteromonas umbrosa TaxID=3048489 RepID=UPI0024C41D03|nr:hypothetical protein [Pseudoalteromonas sp. B95]MDK1286318.1 hypothetical protein [Pseudoalteromonas sp. B95]